MGITPSVADRAYSLGQTLRVGEQPRPATEPDAAPVERRTLDNTTVHIVMPMSWPLGWNLTEVALDGLRRSPGTMKFKIKEGSIARMRNEGVRVAREAGAHAILFVDGDMVFEEDALERLMAHDVPAVGGHCLQTTEPFSPTLWRRRGDGLMRVAPSGHGLMEVDGTGGAFLLIDCEVFDTLDKVCGTEGAYFRDFRDRMDLPPEQRVSEDLWFCTQVRKAGYPLYVDLDCRIGHIVTGFVEPDSTHAPQLKLIRGDRRN